MVKLRYIFFVGSLLLSSLVYSQPCLSESISNKKIKNKLHNKCEFKLDTNLLRFDGVYLDKIVGDSSVWYYFVRFYPDGTLIWSLRYCDFPFSNERINIIGNKGYYIVKGNKLIIQDYNVYLGCYYLFMDIYSGKIVHNSYQKRLGRGKTIEHRGKSAYTFISDSVEVK